jgi:zinc/manganese transport system substrate-binding protein
MLVKRGIWAVAASVALALTVAGCGQDKATSDHPSGALTVVASTDVWGSVASAVAGDHATVKSIVTSPSADPHSFEASPSDAAAISDASLVVYNGGGYDHWVDDVLAGHQGVPTVNAYSLLPSAAPGANEHVFYDLETAKAVANQIADKLGQADAAHANDYKSNAANFGDQADTLATAERAIGQAHPGVSVVATEPVAHYLLVNSGIADRTPPTFASAMEEGDDPSPADVAAVLDLINSRQVSALVLNKQTETPVTNQLRDAAGKASIPIIEVTETLPEGLNYLDWQRQTVDEFGKDLDQAALPAR